MEQWEYKVLDLTPGNAQRAESELNAQGEEAWELIEAISFDVAEHIPGIIRYVFKRRRSLQQTETEDLSKSTRKAPLSSHTEPPRVLYG